MSFSSLCFTSKCETGFTVVLPIGLGLSAGELNRTTNYIVALPFSVRMRALQYNANKWYKHMVHNYHPINILRITMNWDGGSPFVRMSARCSKVLMYLASIPFSFPIWERKKWYLRARYLLRVDILGTFTKDRHPWLSSNTVDRTRLCLTKGRSNLVPISCNKALMGSSSLMAMLKATYSAGVEERQN